MLDFLPVLWGPKKSAGTVTFEVVVIDNKRRQRVAPEHAEHWGDLCPLFLPDVCVANHERVGARRIECTGSGEEPLLS